MRPLSRYTVAPPGAGLGDTGLMSDLAGDLGLDCPRCGRAVTTRFYGPCPACAEALAEAYPGAGREVEAPEYVPKMNVTPNAVATKD